MPQDYEINEYAKEESWRLFRIIGELVEGFDRLSGIGPAVSIYGSAQVKEGDKLYSQTKDIARALGQQGFSIITGGGPGVMEAANRGALEAGVESIGLNIELPEEQYPNSYTTKSITVRHFFVRKIMLVKYATAFIIMPGGLGTLDEMSELLTLIQTHKVKPFPVILFDRKYWNGFLNWLNDSVLMKGYIHKEDCDLLRICDSTDEVINAVKNWFHDHQLEGRAVLSK